MSRTARAAALAAALFVPGLGHAEGVEITGATVPPSAQPGADLPLLMTLRNRAGEADALLRVRCPFANFAEKHTVDHGEGAPAMRAVASIPLPAGATVTFTTDGFHVMLLQTRQPLAEGESYDCTAAFRRAGTIGFAVRVAPLPPER